MDTGKIPRNGQLTRITLAVVPIILVASILGLAQVWKTSMSRAEVREEIRTQVPVLIKPELDQVKQVLDDVRAEQIRQGVEQRVIIQQLDRLLQQP